jgi:ABC-2 type transport system permease protein
MMGMAVSVAEERELGTLDGILVAPINRLSIILGKTFSQAVRGLMQAMIILILAIALFGVVIHGSIPLVILLLLLGIFSFMGLGILISTLSSKQETAMTIMMTIQFPMIFLCGAFFPVEQMPSFMQGISKAIPLTYAVDALRKVIVLGAGIPDITTELIVLVVSGAVLLAIAIPLFNRATTR